MPSHTDDGLWQGGFADVWRGGVTADVTADGHRQLQPQPQRLRHLSLHTGLKLQTKWRQHMKLESRRQARLLSQRKLGGSADLEDQDPSNPGDVDGGAGRSGWSE